MTAFWTIAPEETLFTAEPESVSYREANCGGVSLIVEDVSEEQCKIVRILSTDPADYLNDGLQPGRLLRKGIY